MNSLNIWMWPKFNESNKYNELLSRSLEEQGLVVKEFNKFQIFKLKKNDIFHFHWISYAYQSDNIILFILKSVFLIMYLLLLKIKGVKIVWTLHNLYPHNIKFKIMERIVRSIIIRLVNRVIVASKSIKEAVKNEFKLTEKKISIVRHGNYLNAYPEKKIYKKDYGIQSDSFVFLFFGAIKKYKNVIYLIEEFLKSDVHKKSVLVIAGKPDSYMRKKLEFYKDSKNLKLDLRFIPEEELFGLIKMSDIVVLPYKEITTSGSAILALTAKTPFIAPKTAFFTEYFNEDVCFLYEDRQLRYVLSDAQNKKFCIDSFNSILNSLDRTKIAIKIKQIYLAINYKNYH
jgi:beta-1,4-mannosyltransferase